MLSFPLYRDRVRKVEGSCDSRFVTSQLQGRDVNPNLSDLESQVCPTWSQLPLRVQKLQASPHIKPPSRLHSIATLPTLLWGTLSQGPSLSQLQQGSPSSADKPQDSHSHISVAALCSGEPGSLPSASFSMTLLHHFHGSDGEESACSSGDAGEMGLIPAFGKIPWRRARQPTPVFLPREFHRQRTLMGYSSRGSKESDTTERLSLTSLPNNAFESCLSMMTLILFVLIP